jgi:hypothetical protein
VGVLALEQTGTLHGSDDVLEHPGIADRRAVEATEAYAEGGEELVGMARRVRLHRHRRPVAKYLKHAFAS